MSGPHASGPEPGAYFKSADEGAGPLPWSHVAEQMTPARNYLVATASCDGRPHCMRVWGAWLDERFWFNMGRPSPIARFPW